METVEPEVRTQMPVVDGLSTDFLAQLDSEETPFANAIRRVIGTAGGKDDEVAAFQNYS